MTHVLCRDAKAHTIPIAHPFDFAPDFEDSFVLRFLQVPESLSDKVLAVECAETGGTLDCYAERFAVLDNQRYLVAYPKVLAPCIVYYQVSVPRGGRLRNEPRSPAANYSRAGGDDIVFE